MFHNVTGLNNTIFYRSKQVGAECFTKPQVSAECFSKPQVGAECFRKQEVGAECFRKPQVGINNVLYSKRLVLFKVF